MLRIPIEKATNVGKPTFMLGGGGLAPNGTYQGLLPIFDK